MQEELIVIGKITKPHGVKGELRVLPSSNNPHRFAQLNDIWLIGEDRQPVLQHIKGVRYHRNFVLLKLTGYDTLSQAEQLAGAELGIPKSRLRQLPDNTFYQFDIIGLKVYTADRRYLGKIKSILSTGSNDVYVVKGEAAEYLIPAIKQAIKELDIAQGYIVLNALEGLIDPHAV